MEHTIKALDLLQQLQNTIETQHQEIEKLQSQITILKGQNDTLRKERNDLRGENSEQLARIAQLSRKTSLDSSPPLRYPSTSPSPSRDRHISIFSPTIQERELSGDQDTDYEEEEIVDSEIKRIIQDPSNTPPILGSTKRRSTSPNSRRKNKTLPAPPNNHKIDRNLVPLSPSPNKERPILPIPVNVEEDFRGSPMSVGSSDLSSNEGSVTSLDHEPLSPTISVTSNISSSQPSTPVIKVSNGRRSTTGRMIGPIYSGEEKWDGDDDDDIFEKSMPPIRSRLATVGAHGMMMKRRPGAKAEKKARPLRRRNSYPRRGNKAGIWDINYLSPDMEMKIQQMIQLALGTKYGGLERATKAAVTIQRAYRKHKIDKHFQRLRQLQQDTMQRRRTMSTHFPRGRRPSMLSRKSRAVNKTVTSVDPMTQVRTMYHNITKSRLSPSVSRRELLKMSSSSLTTSTQQPLLVQEHVSVQHNMPLEGPPLHVQKLYKQVSSDHLPNQLSMIDEFEDDSDSQKLFSAEDLDTQLPRPHSIFSGISSSTIQKMFASSHPIIIHKKESASTLRRKTNVGASIFNRKPQRGIQYLVFEGVLEDNPEAVARFLNNCYGISKEKIGEFVGEIRSDFNMAVLECLVELIDLADKSIDEAIREFQQLFRMPGEAQKIDKIMQVFASEYYKHNEGGIIKSEDAAYVLSFAIMMLHTDLHNPSVKRHMTKKDWLRMNRGTNDDENYPDDFLLTIYDNIQQKEFETGRDHTHHVSEIRKQIVGSGCPPMLNAQRRFLQQCEVFQVNDMNKRHIRKHRRTLFLFNDIMLVTKPVAVGKNEFRKVFTLLNSQAIAFNTHNYKYGVCLQHEMSGETYCCNCDHEGDRTRLINRISEAIQELQELERERISDLSMKNKKTNAVESDLVKSDCPGDLLTSKALSSSAHDLHVIINDGVDFHRNATTNHMKPDPTKRSSKDSGFDSPHTTSPIPTTISLPTTIYLSPSRNIQHDQDRIKSPEPRSRTPEPRRIMKIIPDTTNNRSATLQHRGSLSANTSPSHNSYNTTTRMSTPTESSIFRFRSDLKDKKKKGNRISSVK